MCTDDSVASALWSSFKQIPAPAIPGMLDCVLASTGILPATLFASLLESAASSLLALQDAARDVKILNSGQTSALMSMVVGLCHLLKKIGKAPDILESYIWKCLVPLVKAVRTFEGEIINQVLESFFDAVSVTNSWDVLGATLVPFSLIGVGLSVDMIQNGHTNVSDWGEGLAYLSLGSSSTDNGLDIDSATSPPVPFPLPVSCHILTLILVAAQKRSQDTSTMGSELESACCEDLFVNLLWDLCNMSERLLLQSLEHRSCAISFFLPAILKSFIFKSSLEVPSSGNKVKLSSDLFFRKIWKCCVSLFSFGSLERKDAYRILSLYLSFFPCVNECEKTEKAVGAEQFDLRAEREFWDEMKRGLVDEEEFVRKQTLHVLKVALRISRENHCQADVLQKNLQDTNLVSRGMTKKEMWAEKEAKSLGVGKFSLIDSSANIKQQWEAFFLLYEMLDEYGTHLVEAAWSHQIKLLLQFCDSHDNFVTIIGGKIYQNRMESSKEACSWLAILWQLGFRHENPLVRCLIMQSFLGVEWRRYVEFARSVPESFILGPLLDALNDPVHHSDFGIKGVYTSRTTEGASGFLHQYASCLHERDGIAFVHNLAITCKKQSFGRAGLMCISECVASASSSVGAGGDSEVAFSKDATSTEAQVKTCANQPLRCDKTDLLDALRYIVETSKQHFNPNYRLRVCEKVLEATASILSPLDVPVEVVLHFISTIPREFTDYGGYLRKRAQEWLLGCDKIQLLRSFQDFPERFTSSQGNLGTVSVNDGDIDAWESEARRWVRVLFLTIKEENEFSPVVMFISHYGVHIRNPSKHFSPLKFLVLLISLVMETEITREKACKNVVRLCAGDKLEAADDSLIIENLLKAFLLILEELAAFANTCSSVFWSNAVVDSTLPNSVRGKLGGPSQRRLSSSNTAAVLQAITSVRAVVSVASWCVQLKQGSQLNSAWIFMWKFFWKIVSLPICDAETGAELCLAAYEALATVLRALAFTFSNVTSDLMNQHREMSSAALEDGCLLDPLLLSFSRHINSLLDVGVLARARRAILLNCKWLCVESLLSIPCYAIRNGVVLEDNCMFFSDAAIRSTFSDIVESLENAGEGSALPMLRSVRLSLGLLASANGVDVQMIWPLVRSSWILHANSKKRRIASLAALLSAVLHASIFADERMHFSDNKHGPLKWFAEHLLEEGAKSPRTIRLAALHLTGLWLQYPQTIKFYMKEMKLLTLYGSVAFDEDFEAELADNHDASTEVSVLAQSPDHELTEAFINTELYARVCVAVLFHKLADLALSPESATGNDNSGAAVDSGKLFLLELLYSVVNDKDLAKELYKKYSAIHRRKIRAWQMICVMSNFVTDDIVWRVTNSLHISLQRNNLPAIRQYLETFAINIYLKFPSLVAEQLVPILQDFEMRPQALSSYVFIASNIILHASETIRSRHLDELLPPIIPLLTSHHHSLRGFTQLLLHQVFVKYFPPLDCEGRAIIPLEKRGFEDLRLYLLKNPDCARLRSSMEGYLDAYDPIISCTPAGIFVNRVEEVQFECVPVSLMDEVLRFLNDARDDLRSSMAKDIVMIKNESLKIKDGPSCRRTHAEPTLDSSLDFQKKITLHKHETQDSNSSSISGKSGAFQQFLEIEKEDELLDQLFQSTKLTKEKLKASRQQLILVASLLDRIPNLAGLARTCEVFRASGLTVADKSILRDKQFQLISVTAEKWVPVIEVPVNSVKQFLEKKKHEGFSILGLEQTANSVPLDQYIFPKKIVLVLGREKEGIPVDIIHVLDACIEIPQLGVVRSLNVHVSGAIALWEYTRQQRCH